MSGKKLTELPEVTTLADDDLLLARAGELSSSIKKSNLAETLKLSLFTPFTLTLVDDLNAEEAKQTLNISQILSPDAVIIGDSSVAIASSGATAGEWIVPDAFTTLGSGVYSSDISSSTGHYSGVYSSKGITASNSYSVSIGSIDSTVSGIQAGAYSSQNSTIPGSRAVTVASQDSTASGSQSGVYSSQASTASGIESFVIGSQDSVASGILSGIYSSQDSTASEWLSCVMNSQNSTASAIRGMVVASQNVVNDVPHSLAMGISPGLPEDTAPSADHISIHLFAETGNAYFKGAVDVEGGLTVGGQSIEVRYLGTYIDLAALQAAYPSPTVPGAYAYLDAGTGSSPTKAIWDTSDSEWVEVTGEVGGVESFNSRQGIVLPQSGDYTADQIDDSTSSNKFTTQTEIDKLAGIEAGAEVNTVTQADLDLKAPLQISVASIGVNTTAVNYTTYALTASLDLTLPLSPSPGDWIGFANMSNTTTGRILRNGENIMGLSQDMDIDTLTARGRLTFFNSTLGWVITNE